MQTVPNVTNSVQPQFWLRAQAFSGVVFGIFLAAHLINTWLAAVGATYYDGFQSAARTVYQHPVLELIILVALGVHIAAAVVRWITEPKARAGSPGSERKGARRRWHRAAGIFL